MKVKILLTALTIIGTSFLMPAISCSEEEMKPLKVIAPDLIVESFEFGKFPDKFSPMDNVTHENVRFIPCKTVKGVGYDWGYRLKLKTSRTKIKLCTDCDYLPKRGPEMARPHLPFKKVEETGVSKDGIIYSGGYALTFGLREGKYWIKAWVEGVELPPLFYTIKD